MRKVLSVFIVTSLLFSMIAFAQDVPFLSNEPVADKRLTFEAFENITQLLHAGRLAPHMNCELKVRTSKEERRFSTGTKTVETLELDFYPHGLYADKKIRVLFAADLSTYGTKVNSNHWSGAGEDIKIEAHDFYDHYLRFIHDGKGGLVYLVMGDNLRTYPCMMK